MADGTVFTWGFGGCSAGPRALLCADWFGCSYGRLGHRDGADQMTPKAIADIGPARWAKRQGACMLQLLNA